MPSLPQDDLSHISDLTEPLWEQVRNSRIFLTGGTGFFGSWLVESFLDANRRYGLGAALTILTRDSKRYLARATHLHGVDGLDFVEGDVRNFEFPAGTFQFVIHAATAASAKLSAEDPLEMFTTIVDGTRHTLEFAKAANSRAVLFTSSGAVYGDQPAELTHVTEEYSGGPDPLNPKSVYAEGKRAAEQLCCLYAKQCGFETKIARCFAFVGPHLPLDAHFAIGNFIADAMGRRDIEILGDGTPRRSYLYASDLAIWLWTILLRGENCRPYNVGSEESLSIREIAEHVCDTLSPDLKIRVHQPVDPTKRLLQYVPSTLRARSELSLTETVSIRDAIEKTARWHGWMSAAANTV